MMSAHDRAPTSNGGWPARLGAHRVLRELGSGITGRVLLAETVADGPAGPAGTRVALKLLHDHVRRDPIVLERFAREARLGGELRHPGLLRLFDHARERVDGKTWHYLVLELVEGRTLSRLLEDWGTLPEPLLRDLGAQLAEAVGALHAVGAVHRDVKPANVLLDENLRLKLSDLGVAHLRRALVPLTATGDFVGSPAWASPEQFAGEPIGAAGDLYSIGVLLFEAATGTNPFLARSASETMHRHVSVPAPRLSAVAPGLSSFLDELIATLLAKRPEDRIRDADTLAATLRLGEDSPWWQARSASLSTKWRSLGGVNAAHLGSLEGRDEWLERAERRLDETRQGRGGLVHVTGEAGIGKTALVAEWARRASEHGFDLLVGQAKPGARARPQGPLLEAIRARFGRQDLETLLAQAGMAGAAARERYANLVAGRELPREAHGERRLLTAGHVALLRSLSARRPVAWILEDLHLASEEDLEDLPIVAAGLIGNPVLLVATSRPEPGRTAFEDTEAEGLERWSLPRLDDQALSRLVRAAGHEDLTSTELSDLVRRADGNPFFALALARHVDELESPSAQTSLPGNLQRLLELRLAALPEDWRTLLDAAGVQGGSFDAALVATTLGRPVLEVLQGLAGLERRHGLVRAEASGHRFEHHLLHEAVVAALPASLREALHGRVADALAERWGIPSTPEGFSRLAGPEAVLAAEHLAGAGRAPDAAAAAAAAMRHLLGRHRPDDARALGNRIFALQEPGAEQVEAALLLAEAHRGSGDAEARQRTAARASDLAARSGTRRQRVRAAIALYSTHFEQGNHAASLATIQAAMREEEAARDEPRERALLLAARGYALRGLQRPAEAVGSFREAFREARKSGVEELIDRCLRALGDSAFSLGRLVQARRLLGVHARLFPAEQNPHGAVNRHFLLTILALRRGDEEDALAQARAAREAVALGGSRLDRAFARESELIASLGTGRFADALRLSDHGLRELRSGTTPTLRATTLLNAGAALLAVGEHEQALERLEEGLEIARRSDCAPVLGGGLSMALPLANSAPHLADGEALRRELAGLLDRVADPTLRAPMLLSLGRPATAPDFALTSEQVGHLEEAKRLCDRHGLGNPGPLPACYLVAAGMLPLASLPAPRAGLTPVLAETYAVRALLTGDPEALERVRERFEVMSRGLDAERARSLREQAAIGRLLTLAAGGVRAAR